MLKYCNQYKVPTEVFTAILMQESAYKLDAVNQHCLKGYCQITDYGIAQIHKKSVKRYNFDKQRLLTDLEYSIHAGVKVLSYFKRFSKREPKTWWARYNTGTRPKIQVLLAYDEYVGLVSRYH